MAQVRYTSGVDLLIRFATLFLFFALFAFFTSLVDPSVTYVFDGSAIRTDIAAAVVGLILLVCVMAALPGDFDDYRDAWSALIYVAVTLRILLDFRTATAVAGLFSTRYETWYPIDKLRSLPKRERAIALLDLARRTRRLAPALTPAEAASQKERGIIVSVGSALAWLAFIGMGALRRPGAFDYRGFLLFGLVPAAVVSSALVVLSIWQYRRRIKHAP